MKSKVRKVSSYEVSELIRQTAVSRTTAFADIFFDGMVFQCGKEALLFGETNSAKVCAEALGEYYMGFVQNGRFEICLPPFFAGGPYVVTVYGDTGTVSISVYGGEVFLCAGQSNMEWTMAQCSDCAQVADETAAASYENIRLFKAVQDFGWKDKCRYPIKWESATPNSVRDFSCIGYLFAKRMREVLNVPIGVVSVAVGGSSAVFWQNPTDVMFLKEKGVQIYTDERVFIRRLWAICLCLFLY